VTRFLQSCVQPYYTAADGRPVLSRATNPCLLQPRQLPPASPGDCRVCRPGVPVEPVSCRRDACRPARTTAANRVGTYSRPTTGTSWARTSTDRWRCRLSTRRPPSTRTSPSTPRKTRDDTPATRDVISSFLSMPAVLATMM